jgi:hypothetical protein
MNRRLVISRVSRDKALYGAFQPVDQFSVGQIRLDV